jgi:hypothetical protein
MNLHTLLKLFSAGMGAFAKGRNFRVVLTFVAGATLAVWLSVRLLGLTW